jgi:uncharacterized protein YcbK (DUF882 family)
MPEDRRSENRAIAPHALAAALEDPQRRCFTAVLGLGAAALSGSLAISTPVMAALKLPERRLRMTNAHTWEKLDLVYWADGDYIPDALAAINHLMRDHRADEVKAIDIKLIDQLYILVSSLETEERVHVLSGYRTPETNAKLRARSNGVAKHSLHMEARAMDINIPGVHAKNIQKNAVAMQAGGVGYYAKSGFVHIDTGKVRSWQR